MVDPFKRIVDDITKTSTPDEQFYEDRLKRYDSRESQWPTQIDRAAADLLWGVSIGHADDGSVGGTIDRENFGDATGAHYSTGLGALAGADSSLETALASIDSKRLGTLAFKLNEFRNELDNAQHAGLNLDRALAALVEKAATTAIDVSEGTTEATGRLPFDRTTSVNDLLVQLFSDPDVSAYADVLIEALSDTRTGSLLEKLDEPILTTPLWEPQRRALKAWNENGQTGYVEMATATGKTVLGLAAIALRYGALHPVDTGYISSDTKTKNERILIVAGNNLILEQWRREFDTHLDIPPARTEPTGDGRSTIELDWGRIEFRTAPDLLRASLSGYDFVILDEAHNYRRSGGETVRGWRDVFTELTAESDAILALSGSIDADWTGDESVRNALDTQLDCLLEYDLTEAREDGIIAEFDWQVRYAPAERNATEGVAEQTAVCVRYHDAESGTLDLNALGISLPGGVENRFESYDALRAFVQSNDGRERRGESETFDEFASALLTRRPTWWNLTPRLSAIVDLLDRQPPERNCVVLVGGYEAASALRGLLVKNHGYDPETVIALSGPENRMERIEAFNRTDSAILIGPGKLLGTGVDMPDAEVAINVAKGGVNASLVQRIGRVLRNPSDEKHARFYHVVAQPMDDTALVPYEDGRRMLTRAAEFRTLGKRFGERPTFAVTSDTSSVVTRLERAGSAALDRHTHLWDDIGDENTRRELVALTHVIGADSGEPPAQVQCWDNRTGGESTTPNNRTHYQSLKAAANENEEHAESANTTATASFLDDLQNGERNESTDPGIRALRRRLAAKNASENPDLSTAASKPNPDDRDAERSDDSDDNELGIVDEETPNDRINVHPHQLDAKNRMNNSNGSRAATNSSSGPSRNDLGERQPNDPATGDLVSRDEPRENNGQIANDTPSMSNDQQNPADTDVPHDDNSEPVAVDARTAVNDVDDRTTALMRVALNDLSGAADEERRTQAVDALATGGENVVGSLTRIADIDNADNEAVATRAEEALVDILFESTFESG